MEKMHVYDGTITDADFITDDSDVFALGFVTENSEYFMFGWNADTEHGSMRVLDLDKQEEIFDEELVDFLIETNDDDSFYLFAIVPYKSFYIFVGILYSVKDNIGFYTINARREV